MTPTIAQINIELSRWRDYLVQYTYLERVSGGLDTVRRRIQNLEIILAEKEAQIGL